MTAVPSQHQALNDVDWLRRQYLDLDRTKRDIANEVGCAPSTVGDALRRFDIRKRATPRSAVIVPASWLREAYVDQRRSIAGIAKEVGVARPTIRRAMEEAGIAFRGKDRRPPELDDPAWCEEHQHQPPRKLARLLGCAPNTVRRAMQRHGLMPLRGPDDLPYPELGDAEWLSARHHDDGLTHTQIADLIGCSRSAVTQAMHRVGVLSRPPGRPRHPLLSDANWLREQIEAGRTLEEIGREIGRYATVVRDAVDDHGIRYRP